jgi:S1-C subfamily serine protease
MIGEQAAILNDVPQGAYVIEIISDSPAEDANVEVGDIITSFDGVSLSEEGSSLAEAIMEKRPGNVVVLEIWRDGQELTTTVTLDELK